MASPSPPSTLRRPAPHLLARFALSDIGSDTVGQYLTKGFSLAVCCRNCPKISELTPPLLAARYGHTPDLPIQALARRFTCKSEGGCGSHDVAAFPHFYDQPWTWVGPSA